MDDTVTEFKCFPWSPNRTNKTARNSFPCWFFTLLNPSNRKINVVVSPQDYQVSNEVQTGQTVSKEEYERVLQERNSLNEKLCRKDEEIHKLNNQVRRLNGELEWLLSDSSSATQTGSSSANKDQVSVTTYESNAVTQHQNKEKTIQEDMTQPVQRDIIGARASPVPLYPPMLIRKIPPKPPSSTNEAADAFAYIFERERKKRQLMKENEAGLEAGREELSPELSYTDIFHALMAKGLIYECSETESGLYSHTSYLQICEYHKGGRGHSTENCSQLRLQVRKLMRDGIIKVEPPNLVVVLNNSSVSNNGNCS